MAFRASIVKIQPDIVIFVNESIGGSSVMVGSTVMEKLLVAQFAKWPEAGNVKTRIAKKVGDEKALEIHWELLQTVMGNLRSVEATFFEFWLSEDGFQTKSNGGRVLKLIEQYDAHYQIQRGSSLGERMANTIQSSLASFSKVIIVGSDCPNVTHNTIHQARLALDKHDLVFQPAEDGGYVLVGARQFDPIIFRGVEWGKGEVLQQTLENTEQAKFSYSLLEESWDVDEYEDYLRWKND